MRLSFSVSGRGRGCGPCCCEGVKAQQALPQVDVTAAGESRSPLAPSHDVLVKTEALDAARANIFAPVGANAYEIDETTINNLPQGQDTPLEKVLLQAPGVSQDSAASGDLHIRNEHANVQYRINDILLPDGVSGFGLMLETRFISSLDTARRRFAGPIWPAHGRRGRYPDTQRDISAGRQPERLRRQPCDAHAELR